MSDHTPMTLPEALEMHGTARDAAMMALKIRNEIEQLVTAIHTAEQHAITIETCARKLRARGRMGCVPRRAGDAMNQPPLGAIHNGRVLLARLLTYDFECEAGPLAHCVELQGVLQCFEEMAEWIEEEGDGWEPSEAQQGLIPIPDGYNEQ